MAGQLQDRATAFVERLQRELVGARRMVARARRLADPLAWEYDEVRRPVRLRASLWTRLLGEASTLHAEIQQREEPALADELRGLVAALQVAEEMRLGSRVRTLADPSSDREHAEDLLLDLAQGRLNARRISSSRPTAYGAMLRREWLRPRARLLKIVEG